MPSKRGHLTYQVRNSWMKTVNFSEFYNAKEGTIDAQSPF